MPTVPTEQRIVSQGEGRVQPFMPGERFTWKTTGPANGGAIDFAELDLDPDVKVPEHIHHAHDELYYVLEGDYRFKVGDEIGDASRGTVVFIPRGTPHAWSNVGSTRGQVAVVFTPGGMSGFFRELEPLIPQMMVGIADMSKVDPAVLAEVEAIFERYRYQIVGPPLD